MLDDPDRYAVLAARVDGHPRRGYELARALGRRRGRSAAVEPAEGTASELHDDQTGELARWSRLSESNRRPSHYEEDFQRCIRPLPASLLTRPHAPRADSTMGFQDFAPRVAPRGSPSPVALASRLLPDHRGSPVSWSHHWVWFGGRLNTSELSEDRRRPAGHGRAHDRLDQLEPLRTAAAQPRRGPRA
jgi:hypothetical protein